MKLKPEDTAQLGDVIHFTDGTKREVMRPKDEPGSIVGFTIAYLLDMGHIKKVTRKAPKERELGPDELMQGGDIVRYAKPSEEHMTISPEGGWVGVPAGCLSYASKKVYHQVKKSRTPRKEWKRRCLSAIEYCEQMTPIKGSVIANTIEILKGNQ